MPITKRRFAVAAAVMLIAAPALAHDYVAGGVEIAHPWSRPAAKGGSGIGFATLTNTGKDVVSLVGVKSDGAVSASVHRTVQQNGIFTMQAIPVLILAPGQTVKFEPGGYHVMFVGLKAPLTSGGKLPATLTFKRGAQTIPVAVTFNVDPAPEEHKH